MSNSDLDIGALINSYRPNYSLPAQFYTDPLLYQHDLESIFSRSWIYAGHISHRTAGADQIMVMESDDTLGFRALDVVWRTDTDVFAQNGVQPGDRVIVTRLPSPVTGMPLRTASSETPQGEPSSGPNVDPVVEEPGGTAAPVDDDVAAAATESSALVE